MGMKIKYLSVILIVIILAAAMAGCGPYEAALPLFGRGAAWTFACALWRLIMSLLKI
jgi:hypothetical protein